MPDVTITGLNIVARPRPNAGGSRILAHFDCKVAGIELRGCVLVRTNKDGMVAWPPKLEGPEAVRRSVAFVDDALRHALMSSARDVYRMMGGTEAEWVKGKLDATPESSGLFKQNLHFSLSD